MVDTDRKLGIYIPGKAGPVQVDRRVAADAAAKVYTISGLLLKFRQCAELEVVRMQRRIGDLIVVRGR
jgi:hypothetical protein